MSETRTYRLTAISPDGSVACRESFRGPDAKDGMSPEIVRMRVAAMKRRYPTCVVTVEVTEERSQ